MRETLRSILDSVHFRKSKRYPALLECVVKHTLDGNLDALNERAVAIEVFGRSTDYEPSTDSIVRNSLGEVRRRLALYFGEHPDAQVRIDLPHGSHTAEFSFGTQPVDANDEEQQSIRAPSQSSEHQGVMRWRWTFAAAAVALVVISLAITGIKLLNPASPLDRFWAPILSSQEHVTIALGAPFEQALRPSGSHPQDNALLHYMTQLPNSPVPDISAANSIDQFLTTRGAKSEIRMANSIQFSDLHLAPAVIIGAGQMNSWAARLGAELRFQFQQTADGRAHSIIDTKNPSNSEWQVNIDRPYDQVSRDFALITRQLNPTTGQWWIGIGGTTAISTDEAERLVLDPAAMKSIEAQLPSGWDRKNLQFVVELTLVNGSAGGSRVIASDVW